MKALNDELQMRSDWTLPICSGDERLKDADGDKAHSTQKPESLLHRVIVSSTQARRCDRSIRSSARARRARWRGVSAATSSASSAKRNMPAIARERIAGIERAPDETPSKSQNQSAREPRIPFGWVVERGLLPPGTVLRGSGKRHRAKVRADGTLVCADATGSIHRIGAHVQGLDACNGWTFWQYEHKGTLVSIDVLRQRLRADLA